jgi:hypothetical protein
MTTDFTSLPLVHTIDGVADIAVERDLLYTTEQGALPFDVYRPTDATAPTAVVVIVTGLPDPGVVAMLGKPLKEWGSNVGWARLIAASGMAAVTYTNRTAADVTALIRHLRTNAGALGIDAARIGVWACSGSVPNALGVLAHDHPACAALLYGYLLDLDGATDVADAVPKFHFANPAVSIDDLPRTTPILIVRAGGDTTPGLEPTMQRFLAAARTRGLAVTLLDHPDAPHAFDLVDDSPRTHEVIDGVLAFLKDHLG